MHGQPHIRFNSIVFFLADILFLGFVLDLDEYNFSLVDVFFVWLSYIRVTLHYGKGKGKAVPLQAWSGPEGSKKLRFPDFMTTAQDGGMVVSLLHRPP